MPIILGPDGPSLGGFVCPATIVEAELWKMGQLKAGDTVRFVPVTLDEARRRWRCAGARDRDAARREPRRALPPCAADVRSRRSSRQRREPATAPAVVIRQDGDAQPAGRVRPAGARPGAALPRPRADAGARGAARCPASSTSRPASARCRSTTTTARLPREQLLDALERASRRRCRATDDIEVPSRIVHLPLSWDDPATPLAIQQVHAVGAPRRALVPEQHRVHPPHQRPRQRSTTSRRIVFDASYLVLGLGDVYLGAPVATPLDPRHRLVTTKYNPARTWTPENAVGIGGAYLCVYGMEGPGRLPVRRPHLPDVEPLSRDAPSSRRASPGCCASSTRSASIPVSERRAARVPRRVSARPRRRCRSRTTTFRFADYRAFLRRERRRRSRRSGAPAGRVRRRARALGRAAAAARRADRRRRPPARGDRARRARSRSAPQSPAASGRSPSGRATRVAAGDRLVVLETMKMETPVLAPAAGRRRRRLLRARRAGAPGPDADGFARRRVARRQRATVTSCESSPHSHYRGVRRVVQHPRNQVGRGRGAAAGCSSTRNGPPARRHPTRAIQVCGRAVAGATSVATGA